MTVKAADNRYARVKYGQTKYGASSAPVIAWGIEADWDNDHIFESNEDFRMCGIHGFRGRMNMLQAAGGGFEALQSGRYTIKLNNNDGRYDSWNAASPLYPNVTYGREIRIRVRDLNGSAAPYPIMRGIITDIVPTRDYLGNATVDLIVEDAWVYLRKSKARVALQEAIQADDAMALVLASVKWPERWGQALDAASDTPIYFWALKDESPAQLLKDLADSGLGSFFIAATGVATFLLRSNIPAAVMSITQDMVLYDVSTSQRWANLRNIVRMTANPRKKENSQVIWQLTADPPIIQPGETLTFWATYSYSGEDCPATDVLDPVPTTDWTTNTLSGGGGTDETGDCTLVITDFGDTAKIAVTNNSAGQVYLTMAKIYGKPVHLANKLDGTYPADPSTVDDPQEFVQDLPWQQDLNYAVSFADVLGAFLGSTWPIIPLKMQGRPDKQFVADLFNTGSVTLPKLGLNGVSMRVAGIGIDSQDDGCQDIITTLYLEPYPSVGAAAIYDTDVYDTGVYGW